MNIVFIGMRGSGKTTVGRKIAQKLKRKFVDTDDKIIKKEQTTITTIVKNKGWDYFRRQESAAIQEISKQNMLVIATGGGVVERQENIQMLKRNSVIFYLEAKLETLMNRNKNYNDRPLVTNERTFYKDMETLLKQRQRLYRKKADERVLTDKLNIDDVVTVILEKLKTYEH